MEVSNGTWLEVRYLLGCNIPKITRHGLFEGVDFAFEESRNSETIRYLYILGF